MGIIEWIILMTHETIFQNARATNHTTAITHAPTVPATMTTTTPRVQQATIHMVQQATTHTVQQATTLMEPATPTANTTPATTTATNLNIIELTELLSYPAYFRVPHWLSMGLAEISRVTLTGQYEPITSGLAAKLSHLLWASNRRMKIR